MNNKDYEKYEKILNDFEVQEKIADVFISVSKCLGYEFYDEDMKDTTEDLIQNELGTERIDVETVSFVIYKEFKKWLES